MAETPTIANSTWMTTGELAAHYSVHRDTVWGWIKEGIDTPAGRVRLYARRIGGWWKTTLEHAENFLAALNSTATESAGETPAAAETRAEKAHERAKKVLGKNKAS